MAGKITRKFPSVHTEIADRNNAVLLPPFKTRRRRKNFTGIEVWRKMAHSLFDSLSGISNMVELFLWHFVFSLFSVRILFGRLAVGISSKIIVEEPPFCRPPTEKKYFFTAMHQYMILNTSFLFRKLRILIKCILLIVY